MHDFKFIDRIDVIQMELIIAKSVLTQVYQNICYYKSLLQLWPILVTVELVQFIIMYPKL